MIIPINYETIHNPFMIITVCVALYLSSNWQTGQSATLSAEFQQMQLFAFPAPLELLVQMLQVAGVCR